MVRSKDISNRIVAMGILLSIFIFGANTSKLQEQFFSHQVNISINSNLPPAIAFDEVNRPVAVSNIEEATPLTTPIEDQSAALFQIEEIEIAQEKILLEAIEITATATMDTGEVIVVAPTATVDSEIGKLSPELATRLQLAQQQSKVLEKDWSVPTESQLIKEKAAQITKSLLSDLEQKKLDTSGVYVSAITDQGEVTPLQREEGKLKADLATLGEDTGFAVVEGELELAEGLVLTDQHHLEIQRYAEGIPQEMAALDLEKGTFKIRMDERQGVLTAQLINSYGVVEGLGTLPLSKVKGPMSARHKIVITPAMGISGGTIASAYSTSNKKLFQSANVRVEGSLLAMKINKNNELNNDSLADNSELILTGDAGAFKQTVSLVSMNDKFSLKLFPDNMISLLSQILADQGSPLNLAAGDSLIYGEIKKRGTPEFGAQVEMLDGQRAIYFGTLELPDLNRQSTGENGLFLFVVKEPGLHTLKVTSRSGESYQINTFSAPGKIVQVFANTPTEVGSVVVRTFDAWTGAPVSARMVFQQNEEDIETNASGVAVIDLPDTTGLSMVERYASPGYLDSRHFYTKAKDHLHLPMVKEDWLQSLSHQHKVNLQINSTVVIGFVQEENFEVIHSADSDEASIMYFDSLGNPSPKGVAGGGFVAFNQPLGFNNYTVISDSSRRIINRVVSNDARFISVINFSFK